MSKKPRQIKKTAPTLICPPSDNLVPNAQLESFFLQTLELNYIRPAKDDDALIDVNLGFGMALGRHETDPLRYRLEFLVKSTTLTPQGIEAGMKIVAHIIGYFNIRPEIDPSERDEFVKLNGVSVLYGLLRGIIASSTGCFPKGRFMMPTVMPQEIVRMARSNPK